MFITLFDLLSHYLPMLKSFPFEIPLPPTLKKLTMLQRHDTQEDCEGTTYLVEGLVYACITLV